MKYFNQVSVCLHVAFVRRSLNFSERVFPFFSYLLCCLYFSTFLSTWSQDEQNINKQMIHKFWKWWTSDIIFITCKTCINNSNIWLCFFTRKITYECPLYYQFLQKRKKINWYLAHSQHMIVWYFFLHLSKIKYECSIHLDFAL